MASELRVNQITSTTGVGTVTFDSGGVTFVGTPNIGNASITSINGGPISGARNRIINGDMRIDQRHAGTQISPVGSGSTFIVDRWSVYSGLGGIFKAGQTLNNVSTPVGFSSYVGVQNISVSSSDVNVLQQSIEGFNFADFDFGKSTAKPITLSFWAYSSVTGLHGGTFMNYAQTRIYPFSWNYTNSNTWQYVNITIPGDTTGTWVGSTNAGAASLIFCLGGGTAYFSGTSGSWISSVGGGTYGVSGQVNLSNISNSTFYITGVQLEPGTVATPFERRSYGQELALCQRYYQASSTARGMAIVNINDTSRNVAIDFCVQMRATPTVTATLSSGTAVINAVSSQNAWVAVAAGNNTAAIQMNSYTASIEI